jgi:glucose/arabinose dehydrogenase
MVRDGAFYGWPYSYYGPNVDKRVKPQRPDLVAKAIKPDYALGSHVAALGLAVTSEGAYIGQHGSWNRKPLLRLQRRIRSIQQRQDLRASRSKCSTAS